MLLEILPTKLNMPAIRPAIVPRPRLFNQLNRIFTTGSPDFSSRLSLISAPAGFGKSMLVIDWARRLKQQMEVQVCWLSLEEQDSNVGRFFCYLVAALQTAEPTWGHITLKMLQAPERPSSGALMGSLIQDISTTKKRLPVILVLDDFHTVSLRAIHDALTFLIEHQPPQMHLVIITREDPLMPLARLRAQRQLVELRLADLRFSREETAVFLQNVKGLALEDADVAALEARTEGWIAGLQLVALSLQQSEDASAFIRTFTGSSRYLLDYLIEEVMVKQPGPVQSFLLNTSILSRFNAALCDAVTEQNDSSTLIARLQQSNLFLIGLDDEGQWFRYHHLFAELLRHRLKLITQDMALLHSRAGRWLQSQGYPEEAIPHFLAARAWPQAANALGLVSEKMLRRGEATTLIAWLAQLPKALFNESPALTMSQVWAFLMTGQLDAAEFRLEHLVDLAQHSPQLKLEVLVAQAYLARMRYDTPRTIEISSQALALMPLENVENRSILSLNLGIAHWHARHLAEAERVLTEARFTAEQARNRYARDMAVGFLGLVQGAQAKLVQAASTMRQALATGEQSPTKALVHRVLAGILYEWNELEPAAEHLELAEKWAEAIGNMELLTGILRGWTLLKLGLGDGLGASQILTRLHALSSQHQLPPYSLACNAAVHTQVALAQGDMAAAVHWANQVNEPADGSPFFPQLDLTSARLLLAQEKKAAARQQLDALFTQAKSAQCVWGLVEVRALQALAAPKNDEARAYLKEALLLAQPARLVRTFTDKGQSMAGLLRQAAQQTELKAYIHAILPSFNAAAAMATPADPSPPTAGAQVEPLSERELEILPLLAEGFTNAEIARSLCLSVNTVKTHLRHIYEKLAVHNRRTAVAQAQALLLLPDDKSFSSP